MPKGKSLHTYLTKLLETRGPKWLHSVKCMYESILFDTTLCYIHLPLSPKWSLVPPTHPTTLSRRTPWFEIVNLRGVPLSVITTVLMCMHARSVSDTMCNRVHTFVCLAEAGSKEVRSNKWRIGLQPLMQPQDNNAYYST